MMDCAQFCFRDQKKSRSLRKQGIGNRICGNCHRAIRREAVMTTEEQLVKRYFDAFNRHDIEEVVACFHQEAVLVGPNGKRLAGLGSSTLRGGVRFP
jgi:Domain of unknown function (DUF4440)